MTPFITAFRQIMMSSLICIAAVLSYPTFGLAQSCGLASDALKLWPMSDGGNGHSYQVAIAVLPLTWPEAERAARLAGGYLATIESSQENDFVFSLIDNALSWTLDVGPFLGGIGTPDGTLAWITGEPFTYSNWGKGEPVTVSPDDIIAYARSAESRSNSWQLVSQSTLARAYVIEFDENTPRLGRPYLRVINASGQSFVLQPGPGANDGTDDGSREAGKDAWTESCHPDTNHGSSESLLASMTSGCDSCGGTQKTYIRFNLDGLPTPMDNALLGFYFLGKGSCDEHCNINFSIVGLTSDWNEMTITANTAPSEMSASLDDVVPISAPSNPEFIEIPIPHLYEYWKENPNANYGLVIESTYSGCNTTAARFAVSSSDLVPAVTSLYPLPNDKYASINSVISATFAVDLATTSVNATTFMVYDEYNIPIPGTAIYDTVTRTASFTPSYSLVENKQYTAVLDTAIEDADNNFILCSDIVWKFFTNDITEARAYYPLNGTLKDAAGNYGDAVVASGSLKYVPGQIGLAAQFDGAMYLQTPVPIQTPPLAYALWFQTTTVLGYQTLLDSSTDADTGYGLHLNLDDGVFAVSTPDGFRNTTVPVPIGMWTHVAMSVANEEIRIYLNGELREMLPLTTSSMLTGIPMQMGHHTTSDPKWFSGKMDQVRVYNRQLLGSDVRELYLSGSKLDILPVIINLLTATETGGGLSGTTR
ncbi:LamG-like jellyroll fold domain-containing protein [Desulfovibrio inopinatus]|uniref:LamG-like jellyroll fold domain-containing protein n=1 Tax=Desulfovibrio inopinatus TaxID=102109 RepID=UPI00041632D0|nr:LamG-like jellyroll fold domain-containing protein [Desulfovibrio inopinatus]